MIAAPQFSVTYADGTLRRCALTLHAIRAQDRALVLSRLTGPKRGHLEHLIAELDALGISPDAQLARRAIAWPGTPPVVNRRGMELADEVAMRESDAAELASILAGESTPLVVQVLLMRDAAIRATYLTLLSPAQRDVLQTELEPFIVAPGRPPSALGHVLAELLTRRWRAVSNAAAGSRIGAFALRWKGRLRSAVRSTR